MKTAITKILASALFYVTTSILLSTHAQTSITGFSPKAQFVGQTVTITGGFTLPINSVYFGSIKQSTLISNTSTKIVCNVPNGASFDYISILDANGYGFSAQKFVPRFAGNNTLTATNFINPYPNGTLYFPNLTFLVHSSFTKDLNNDGISEIIDFINDESTGEGVSIFQYTSTSNYPNTYITLPFLGIQGTGVAMEVADITNDGLPEIILVSASNNTLLTVFKNTSSISGISFDTPVEINVSQITYPSDVKSGDFNNDNKIDLVIADGSSFTVAILKNDMIQGDISGSFTSTFSIATGDNNTDIEASDFDNDGKIDIVCGSATNGDAINFLLNTSSANSISFDTPSIFSWNGNFYPIKDIKVVDIDGDNKNDIALSQTDGISFLRNISTIGDIEMDLPSLVYKSCSPSSFTFGDLDGDGKPDLVVSQSDKDSIVISKNLADIGTFSGTMFSSKNSLYINSYYPLNYLSLADFNADGQPDLSAYYPSNSKQLVFTNAMGTEPKITSIFPLSGKPGDSFTISGQNFANVNSVTIENGAGTNVLIYDYSIISNTQIVATIDLNQSFTITGNVLVSNGLAGKSDQLFSIIPSPDAIVTNILSSNNSGNSFFAKGDFLTITGSNLSDVNSVYLYSQPTSPSGYNFSIINKTDTQIILTFDYCDFFASANSGYYLNFRKAIGNATSAQSITIVAPILPSISGILPLSVLPQDLLTLTGIQLDKINNASLPNNPYYQSAFFYQDPTTIVVKVPNFYSDTVSSGNITLFYCSENAINASQNIDINVPPLPVITGFNPSESYAGAYVTVLGQNLQYATHFNLVESGQSKPKINNAEIIEVSNSQVTIKLDNNFPGNTDILCLLNAYYVEDFNSAFFTSSSSTYTIHPYPQATITGFSPTSVFPFEPVSIFGFNFDYIDRVELPNGYTAYNYEVVSPNLIVARANLASNSTLTDVIYLSYSYQQGNDAFSSESITVNPFDGDIKSITLDKQVYNSNEKLVARVSYNGVLPPPNFVNYDLRIYNDALGSFGGEGPISLSLSSKAMLSSVPGIFDFELDYTSLNHLYPFESSPDYYTVANIYASNEEYYLNSPPSSIFTINAAPEFDQKEPFNPNFAPAGGFVKLKGLNFGNSTITGVFYNLTVPAVFSIPVNNNISSGQVETEYINTTVPQGNTKGKIRITYNNGEIISPYDFNTFPPCSIAFEYISTTLSGSGIYNVGDILNLQVAKDPTTKSESGTIVGFVQLSDSFGIYDSLTTSQIGFDDGIYSLPKNIQVTIPSNAIEGTFYSMQLLYTDGESSCIQFIKDNVTIKGSNLPQYIPVQSMSIYANEDSTNVFPKAFNVMAINAKFVPDSATNQKYKLQLFQSATLIAETDTLDHFFEFVSAANGVATIIGTSLDNPNAISMVVITLIGADGVTTEAIQTRQVIVSGSGQTVYSACDRTIELFIDTTINKYIGYQWYVARSNGDTAKIVDADQPEFRPVVEGNYFVKTYDSAANYSYASFPITVNSPSKPTIARPGIGDIETDTILIASDADKYQWFVNGRLIKNATSKQLRIYYNGIYYVSITNAKTNCKAVSDTVSFTRPDFVDIGRSDLYGTDSTIENYGLSAKNSLKLYPNPATDQFTVQYRSSSIRTLVVKVFSTMGNEMVSQSILYSKNPIRLLTIPTTDLPVGLYYVQIIDGEDVTNKKIIIK